jgi:hypothetical protein
MTTRRSIPLLALAALMVLAPAAHAGPVGNQYLPQVPKAGGNHHHSGGSSGETSSSTYVPTTTTESSGPTRTSEKPAKPKHREKPKHVKITPATSNGDVTASSGGGVWVPLAILGFAAVVSTAAGLTIRRRAA